MSLVDAVVDFFKKKKAGEEASSPSGVCPNCWGSQEYAGLIREIEEDFQMSVSAGNTKHAFIQDFVVNHVDGIKLRNKLEGLTCDKCKMSYPHDDASH